MPWMQDRGCGYVWYQKGKSRIKNKDGYETSCLSDQDFERILDYLRKINLLKGNGKRDKMYWHFPNNEEVEINPENRSITFKKDLRRSVRISLERIIGIEQSDFRH